MGQGTDAIHTRTLTDLARGLKDGEFSSRELTESLLQRIDEHQDRLNAFITVTADVALQGADAADKARANGDESLLNGLPIVHKDLYCTKGVLTTCGSHILGNFVSPYDATVVERINAAGAVMLGKTNMDEFAMGSSNETSYYGPVTNPWNAKLSPGGSSGGSAAAVAARIVPRCDRDGYGRLNPPACGAHRYCRPETNVWPGLPVWHGCFCVQSRPGGGDYAIRRRCRIVAWRHGRLRQKRFDLCRSVRCPITWPVCRSHSKALKIGVVRQHFDEGLAAGCEERVKAALAALKEAGATLIEVDLPNIDLSVPVYYVVAPAECSSNLSRFDGVRFGRRTDNPQDLMDLYCRTRGEGFGAEVQRRIMTGTYVLVGRLLRCVLPQGTEGAATDQRRISKRLLRTSMSLPDPRRRRRRLRSAKKPTIRLRCT